MTPEEMAKLKAMAMNAPKFQAPSVGRAPPATRPGSLPAAPSYDAAFSKYSDQIAKAREYVAAQERERFPPPEARPREMALERARGAAHEMGIGSTLAGQSLDRPGIVSGEVVSEEELTEDEQAQFKRPPEFKQPTEDDLRRRGLPTDWYRSGER